MKTAGGIMVIAGAIHGAIGGTWFTATNEEPSAFGSFGKVAFLSFTPLVLIGLALLAFGARSKRNR